MVKRDDGQDKVGDRGEQGGGGLTGEKDVPPPPQGPHRYQE